MPKKINWNTDVNNVVSDRKFVLVYDFYQFKNPDFNSQHYDPFNLDDIDSTECKAEFRVEKADLPRLAEALQLPLIFHCSQRTAFDSMEGLCMVLKRVSYPCKTAMIPRFGYFKPYNKSHLRLHLRNPRSSNNTVDRNILNPHALRAMVIPSQGKELHSTVISDSSMEPPVRSPNRNILRELFTMDI